MNALKAVLTQFLKDTDKLPGWVPLFVVTLLAVDWAGPPDPLSPELLAGFLTLLLYTAGDALDEVVFKTGPEGARHTREVYKRRYREELSAARDAMGIGDGVYSAALNLVTAGEKQRGKLAVHIPNEAAKGLRALILPLAILAIHFSLQARFGLAVMCLAGALVLLFWYPLLKVHHLRRLYSAASKLAENKSLYDVEDLGTMRLVFWDGNLVGSGRVPTAVNVRRAG